MKKTELIKRLRHIAEALHTTHAELGKLEDTCNELDELRDEVSDTCDVIPESFTERLEQWEEYNSEVDGIADDLDTVKDSFAELEGVIERIEGFIAEHQ